MVHVAQIRQLYDIRGPTRQVLAFVSPTGGVTGIDWKIWCHVPGSPGNATSVHNPVSKPTQTTNKSTPEREHKGSILGRVARTALNHVGGVRFQNQYNRSSNGSSAPGSERNHLPSTNEGEEENGGTRGITTNARIIITNEEITIREISNANRTTGEVRTQIKQHQVKK